MFSIAAELLGWIILFMAGAIVTAMFVDAIVRQAFEARRFRRIIKEAEEKCNEE